MKIELNVKLLSYFSSNKKLNMMCVVKKVINHRKKSHLNLFKIDRMAFRSRFS